MANFSVNQYLQELHNAINRQDGPHFADLLGYKHPHIASKKLQLKDPVTVVVNWFEQPLDEAIANHLRAVWAVCNNNYSEAYMAQVALVQNFCKFLGNQKDDNWMIPALFTVCLDLRLFAMSADKQLAVGSRDPHEKLEKAAEYLMNCFRVCVSDTRAAAEVSKKLGMLGIVNQLFKVYFRTNKLQLCKPLIRAIDQLPEQISGQFSKAHLVAYRYFVGKKAMFDADYKLADELLTFAFERCHRNAHSNKRTILIYLLPVKMQRGRMPSNELLKRYDLLPFLDVKEAVVRGDLLRLNEALATHQEFFIKVGIFLILEKLKVITYRNLFKRTVQLVGSHQVPVDAFRVVLHHMGETDVDTDEVQCIIANLIFDGYLKGYISHQHQKLIVSKQNPFPSLTTIM